MGPSCGFWRGRHAMPIRLDGFWRLHGSMMAGHAAMQLGSAVQIVRDWVVRFNDRGADGLINGKAPGKPSLLNDEQRAALARAIERGPTPYLDGVVRWRLCDLVQWIWEEFRVSVSEETLGREVRAMGYRKLSARPRHIHRILRRQRHLKKLPHRSGRNRRRPRQRQDDRNLVSGRSPNRSKEQDHPALGKTGIKAIRPTRSAHALGIHIRRDLPKARQSSRFVMPWCDTNAMNQHLIEISLNVADDAHAILMMDQAGWHMSSNLAVPENITILPLPHCRPSRPS